MNEIEIFGTFSGLMINRNKTEGLWIGKLKHSKDKVENIKWTNKPIKSLGFYYGHDISLLFLIRRAMISTDKTNSKADKGQP
jgi:hypothetical protein